MEEDFEIERDVVFNDRVNNKDTKYKAIITGTAKKSKTGIFCIETYSTYCFRLIEKDDVPLDVFIEGSGVCQLSETANGSDFGVSGWDVDSGYEENGFDAEKAENDEDSDEYEFMKNIDDSVWSITDELYEKCEKKKEGFDK